jgi:hypothetical protein
MLNAFDLLSATKFSSLSSSARTVSQRANNILNRFGVNAHIYIPGQSNYTDSIGSTIAQVTQPVGLVVDSANTLSAELINSASAWSGSPLITKDINNSSIIFDGSQADNASLTVSGTLTIGKTYIAKWTVVSSQGNVQMAFGGNSTNYVSGSGSFSRILVATSTSACIIQENGAVVNFIGTVSSISLKEIGGINAIQSTTANTTRLQQTNGINYWAFNGTSQSLQLSSIPFQATDDFCVIVGVNCKATAYGQRLFSMKGSGSASIALLITSSGIVTGEFIDNLGVTAVPSVGSNIFLTNIVASLVKKGSAKGVRLNGVVGNYNTTTIGTSTLTLTSIGASASGGGGVNGNIYPLIAIKGTVSDSDLLILEKFVGILSGVTI